MTATIGRRRLEMTADRIEAAFAAQKFTARVWAGTVTPHSVLFVATLGDAGARLNWRNMAEEIGLALGCPVRLYQIAGTGTVRVRVFGL